MGRRVSRSISRVVRRVTGTAVRAVDTVTGDILDLDQSKQKEALENMRKEQERQEAELERKEQAEKDYQAQVASEKDKIAQESSDISSDSTGVGLQDVKIDFSKSLSSKSDEDDLKKALQRKY